MYRARKVFTHAEIKDLPITAVELVPARGAGKLIIPIAFALQTRTVVPYTNIDAGLILSLVYGDHGGSILGQFYRADLALNGTEQRVMRGNLQQSVDLVGGSTFTLQDNNGACLNLPVSLDGYNVAAGSLTAGDAANTMVVTMLYEVISF